MSLDQHLRSEWSIPVGVTYLNHGSFGPTPNVVQAERARWSQALANQPMNFYLREMEPALDAALVTLAELVGTSPHHLAFVDNATAGMNVVSSTLRLAPGDEVLLNPHEYGAVFRIWQRACEIQGARVVSAPVTVPFTTAEAFVEELFAGVTARTRLIVVSHVTSPTATVLPIAAVCARARQAGIPVCIDGPHAPGAVDINLRQLGCDFYCASLHKWLSAPLGTGFLYVAPRWQQNLQEPFVSWGRSLSGKAVKWQDPFHWQGTRDPAGWLSVPRAIQFLKDYGIERFRQRSAALVAIARERLEEWTGHAAITPAMPGWASTMVTVPLRHGEPLRDKPNAFDPLQARLFAESGIEIPVMDWQGRRHLRVSCHLYNSEADLDLLMTALRGLESLS